MADSQKLNYELVPYSNGLNVHVSILVSPSGQAVKVVILMPLGQSDYLFIQLTWVIHSLALYTHLTGTEIRYARGPVHTIRSVTQMLLRDLVYGGMRIFSFS